MFENEVCPNCECELEGDCCGGGQPFRLDEILYCCEPCAVDGECECGCLATPVAPPSEQGQAQTGPLLGVG